MHLQRIQVPDFRVLKNVDITFEKKFVPSIFPLGSQNGGGKSTLLQLIFVLLHCSSDPDKIPFLKNILYGLKIYDDSEKRVLAIFDIWDGEKIINLEFFCRKDSSIQELLGANNDDETIDYSDFRFSVPNKLEEFKTKLVVLKEESSNLAQLERNLKEKKEKDIIIEVKASNQRLEENGIFLIAVDNIRKAFIDEGINYPLSDSISMIVKDIKERIKFYQEKQNKIENILPKIIEYMKTEKLLYISNYSSHENGSEDEVLLCHINDLDITESKLFLNKLSQKIFLAAPATQIFIFMSKDSRKLLLKAAPKEDNNYYSEIQDVKSKITSLFTYDFLSVELIIKAFLDARDQDFIEAIETGEYGNNYKAIKRELNQILYNKKINIDKEFSEITFKLDRNGETIELSPEDLSHGELKRLSIYMWLKYRNIENAIVLMDEIEIAFHPDWQYQIISDLKEWSPSNQYILATHSYELCQALTPAHVKELEPKLLKQEV
ncbi:MULTISPECIES: AAA family ATPase [unclassified Coleofasciculus]|uniref:AAA family ATPase n=1 Tax=unclassified Coleofasciculus TaxID=2692782 RepID=UPI00187F96A0|nr:MULTISPECIES: AAA family ATPase [unclassified Coleofasciculus]MBE9125182.1 AAA family ATPase [Coleofasciculus sp. LEGE 07081]MBE9148759.1 AAA family ATPase [Coleofasciculus sp. LEGE 07092]